MLYRIEGRNYTQISTQEFADLLGITAEKVAKIEKSPVFEILPAKTKPDKLNGGIIAPAGIRRKPVITVKDSNGKTITLRYADGEPVPDEKNERISHWSPKRIGFSDTLEIVPELDKALFLYCIPDCASTPLASQVTDAHFTYQDKEEKAKKVIADGTNMGRALVLINSPEANGGLSERALLLTAKGIYAQNREIQTIPNPSAKNKTTMEIRADLTMMVTRENGRLAQLFLSSVDNSLNEFYGMVLDSVDRGIFKIELNGNGTREWRWAYGALNHEAICRIEPGQNDFDALKSTIERDPNKYYSNVIKANQDVSGAENLKNFIAAQNSPRPTGSLIEPVADILPDGGATGEGAAGGQKTASILPGSFNDLRPYMAALNNGKNPTTDLMGPIWALIKNKKVTTVEELNAEIAKVLA